MNAGETRATVESPTADGPHAAGYDGPLAADNQYAPCRFDDGIAAVAGIIDGVAVIHGNGSERTAVAERCAADARHRTRDVDAADGCAPRECERADCRDRIRNHRFGDFHPLQEQAVGMIAGIGRLRFEVDAAPAVQIADFHAVKCRAPRKGMFPDGGDSAGDGHASEGRAVAKCSTVDGNNRVNTVIVADGLWDGHIAIIGIGAAGDNGMAASDMIVYVADFQALPRDGAWQQERQQQDGVLDERFHCDEGRFLR